MKHLLKGMFVGFLITPGLVVMYTILHNVVKALVAGLQIDFFF